MIVPVHGSQMSWDAQLSARFAMDTLYFFTAADGEGVCV